jgi:putative ABC transport system permease protein
MSGAILSWRLAREELRLQPMRFVATLLASTIAIAFLVATQVYLDTETNAVKQRSAVWASHADVVVDTHVWNSWRSLTDRDAGLAIAEKTLAADPSVTDVERFSQLRSLLTHEGFGADVMLTSTVRAPALRWYVPVQGRAPVTAGEVMLTREVAHDLQVGIGDRVRLSRLAGGELTVVGLTDDGGYTRAPAYVDLAFFQRSDVVLLPPPPGTIARPDEAAQQTPGSSGSAVGVDLLVASKHPPETVQRVQRALTDQVILGSIAKPWLASEVVDAAAAGTRGGTAWLPWVLVGSAALALFVGALTITATQRMLLTARRRNVALLRAVGAHRGQAARWMLAESTLLWLVSAGIAVPLGLGGAWLAAASRPGTLAFGLVIDWWRVALAVVATGLVTVLASAAPAWQASRVPPLEALSTVALPTGKGRRGSRDLVTAVVALAAVVVAVVSHGRWWPTLAAGTVVAAALLVLMRPAARAAATWLGRVARRPVTVAASGNLTRNPARTGAAVVAMTVPLLVFAGLLAGASVGRSGAHARLDQLYPVDLSLASAKLDPESTDPVNGQVSTGSKDSDGYYIGFDAHALATVRATPGVRDAAMFRTTQPVTILAGPGIFSTLPIARVTPDATRLSRSGSHLAEGWIGLPTDQLRSLQLRPGASVDLIPVLGNKLRLRVSELNLGPQVAVVGPKTFASLGMASKDGLMLVSLEPRAATSTTLVESLMARLLPDNPALAATGNVQEKALVNARITSVVTLVSTLLAIVALVGLVSVANTLGLSVLERTRESALLRALGASRDDLRRMVMVESLLLAAVAVVSSVVVGTGLGWLGAQALVRRLGMPPGAWGTSPTLVAAGAAATVVTAALASVVPGAIAARATPVQALADVG